MVTAQTLDLDIEVYLRILRVLLTKALLPRAFNLENNYHQFVN